MKFIFLQKYWLASFRARAESAVFYVWRIIRIERYGTCFLPQSTDSPNVPKLLFMKIFHNPSTCVGLWGSEKCQIC